MKRRVIWWLGSLLLLLGCGEAAAQLRMVAPYGDHMVLQQQSEALLRGVAAPRERVTVTPSWGEKSVTTKADAEGRWELGLPTPEGSYTHHSIRVATDDEALELKDVLVGEVWFASGQSNMEMPLRGFYNSPVEGALEEYASAPNPDGVRIFMADRLQAMTPQQECTGRWLRSEPLSRPEMSATAYFFAKRLNGVLNLPIGVVCAPYGGAKVESWMPRELLEQYDDIDLTEEGIERVPWHYWRPMLMYNAMLYPLRGYTVKGFIWYQGCSNTSTWESYAERLEAMVAHWRGLWGDKEAKLPFYTVEIAPYRYKDPVECSKASFLRREQLRAAQTIPNAAMVVTNDLVAEYEKDNIHPARKQPVGDRLAYLALNRDYGFWSIACQSPVATRIERRSRNEVAIYFDNAPNGLNRWRDIEGLEVAGSEGIFVPVSYAYYEWEPKALVIRSEFVFDPMVVRYGWGDFCPGNLASCEGLPVAPFLLRVEE